MDRWGALMQQAVTTVTEMAAIGLGLPRHALTDMLVQGPHLLAPTGSDLSQYNSVGQIFAGALSSVVVGDRARGCARRAEGYGGA